MNDQKYGLGETPFSAEELDEMMSLELAKKRAREKQFNENFARLLSGDGEDNAGPYKLRCIVEHDHWYIPVKSDGSWAILNAQKGEYERLIAGENKADGRRTDRQGRGGQMLPVYAREPGAESVCKVIDGLSLVRSLPSNISALLIQIERSDPLRELGKEYFDQLKSLASAVELESMLVSESGVAAAKLLERDFVAAMYSEGLWQSAGVATLGTHSDSLYVRDPEVTIKSERAKKIFEEVLEDESFCGIVVNPMHEIGASASNITGDITGNIKGLYLSPNFVHRTVCGGGGPLRVERYVARSREEFELFLEQTNFPTPYRIVESKDAQGKPTIQAVSSQSPVSWSIFECDSAQETDQVKTPCFELALAPGSDQEIAAGKSHILCPALMAQKLYGQLPERQRKLNKWCPGKSFGLGRSLSEADIAASRLRLRLANEILKLIPAQGDAIVRQSVLSVQGAKFLGWAGYAGKKSWIEEAREQAKKYDKKFVLG
ncbi:MAG: hypothetical protein IPO31_22015 [Candidatus Obscuribacter sp.]|nr:hypothetical protein [Candidatus Obscuribacter sp.]